MQADGMKSTGISDMLLEGGQRIWKRNSGKACVYICRLLETRQAGTIAQGGIDCT
jgi:hypothetical protein